MYLAVGAGRPAARRLGAVGSWLRPHTVTWYVKVTPALACRQEQASGTCTGGKAGRQEHSPEPQL